MVLSHLDYLFAAICQAQPQPEDEDPLNIEQDLAEP